ncbi:hypothetical protein BKA59DRAFT_466831 [Fusarium tricinctum]|uniref:C2H2-type domain-containing protein n=1 Tax=Fusarium tricinctum TaxID=61284 RepID=A0A8K0S2J8_9HYPO|nr:hypothetical protein BKA59DRAFT_466831 [Fusarium tricinctum]
MDRSSRPHHCSHCGSRFRKFEHLQRHTRIHTNEKPYVCDCGQSFTRRDLLRRHQRLVHPLPSPSPATNSSKPDLNSQGFHGVRETTIASSTAPETSTPATAISASQSQVAVHDTLAITQGDAAVKPGPVLPLPPEYPDMLPSNLEPDTEDGPLSSFQKFVVQSGLVPLLGDSRPNRLNQHEKTGIPHCSGHLSHASPGDIQLNSMLPPDLQDVAIHSDTNIDYQENIDPSDPTFQSYLIQNPNFVPPSAQTTVRYFKSFMRNSRFEVLHPRADINRLPVVVRLAILAIGAWHLFEAHGAMLLFRASRDIALELWTSPQHASTLFEQQNHPVDLASAFLFLLEFVKLEQPSDVFQQLQIMQSALVCFLKPRSRGNQPEPTWRDWVEAETIQRTQAFGFLSVVPHQSICSPQTLVALESLNLRFPCSETVRNSTKSDAFRQEPGIGQVYSGTVAELIDSLFSKTGPQQDVQLQNFPIQSLFILAAALLHRVTLLSQMPTSVLSDDLIIVEYRRLVEIVAECRRVLATMDSSSVLVNDTKVLLQLALTRAVLHTGHVQVQTMYTPSPAKLPALTQDGPGPYQALALSSWFDMNELACYLEEPANTGVTFFIRSQVSCWSLEKIMTVFESMTILASWICYLHDANVSSQEMGVFYNVRTLLQNASSSMEMMDDRIMSLGPKEVAIILLKFWGNIFMDTQNKPFAKQLGEKLCGYAEVNR